MKRYNLLIFVCLITICQVDIGGVTTTPAETNDVTTNTTVTPNENSSQSIPTDSTSLDDSSSTAKPNTSAHLPSTSTTVKVLTTDNTSTTPITTSSQMSTTPASTNSTYTSTTTFETSYSTNSTHMTTSSLVTSILSTIPSVIPNTSAPLVKISESNILLVDTSNITHQFVELEGNPNNEVIGLWLVVRDGSINISSNTPLITMELNVTFSDKGKYVINKNMSKIQGVEAVLIALYSDKTGADNLTTDSMVDALLYSTKGQVDPEFEEIFKHVAQEKLIINYQSLKNLGEISLSRCSEEESFNAAFVLSESSERDENKCILNSNRTLHMKLTWTEQHCNMNQPIKEILKSLKEKIMIEVNTKKQCGLTGLMIKDTDIHSESSCLNTTALEIRLKFKVKAFYDEQLQLVVKGFQDFVQQQTVTLNQHIFVLANCSLQCLDIIIPLQPSSDDNKVQVTVAVVVSCIGVFLLVVLFVIIYMKRKKRGILQFRMTRLDEDDNDLIGDMDDFVGNQGPTFRNYR